MSQTTTTNSNATATSTTINNNSTNGNFKVVLLGEGCVGKTSIVLRFVDDKFNNQHISTLQASFLTKKLTLDNGKRVQLNIWDTAGQERFHALGPIYYRGSQGAILVYDITDEDSFKKVKNWIKELKRMLGTDIVLTIAGNKTDLESERRVEHDEAVSYAESVGAYHFQTSAKANEGIEDLFHELSRLMLMAQQQRQKEPETSSMRLLQGRRGLANQQILIDDSTDNDDDMNATRNGGGDTTRSCCGAG